jgi:hypothetical protein
MERTNVESRSVAADAATSLMNQFNRYAGIITARIANLPAFSAQAESATAVQVERGVLYPLAMLDPTLIDVSPAARLVELSNSPRLVNIAIVDRSSHHRPAYRALLVYSWLQAFRMAYETLPRSEFGRWEEGLRPWCDLLESDLGEISWPEDGMPAGRGASATEAVWIALALSVAGKIYVRDAWIDLASDTFGKLVRSQQSRDPAGPFLHRGPDDSPDSHWYHELVILHAAASYAVQSEDRTVAAAVQRSTSFHFAETQPDHATNLPWAVFPFIWNSSTRSLADTILHASQLSDTRNENLLSLMLLADALYCLRLFK